MSVAPRVIAVTGVDGFVGRHVVAAAHEAGVSVVGIARAPIADPGLRALLAGELVADLTQEWPDVDAGAVIHLAGLAAVEPSFDDPQLYIETNSAMVTHLGEALLRSGARPRVVGVSTGGVYAPRDSPLAEDAPVAASSPYVVSKLLVEYQFAYYAARDLDVVVARPFNHFGPGQSRGFLLPDLVAALQALPDGEPLPVGNLETARDYTDVRDVARAYVTLALAEGPLPAVLNIASGISLKGREVLELAAAALDMPAPATTVDPARMRATDHSVVTGDATLIAKLAGWSPSIPAAQSVADYVRGVLAD